MHWSSTFPCFWIMISTIFKKRWFSWQFWYFRSFSSAIKLKSKIIRLLLFVWKIIGENYILSWQVENKLLTTQHYMQNKNQTNDLILAIFSLKQAKCYGFVPKICIFGPIMGIWILCFPFCFCFFLNDCESKGGSKTTVQSGSFIMKAYCIYNLG